MLDRRAFLKNSLRGSSLVALGTVLPEFLLRTAQAAEPGKDTVLVLIELTGGNDGINTVIPYADDLYHKARPTLRIAKEQVIRLNDYVGLHPAFRSIDKLLKDGQVAVVQGVGYPNPNRSHFESMDVWQSADPERRTGTGWIARSVPDLTAKSHHIPVMQVSPDRLPLALQGASGNVVSINQSGQYRLALSEGSAEHRKAQRKLLEDLARPGAIATAGTRTQPGGDSAKDDLLSFVRRRQVGTYTTLDRLQELLSKNDGQQQNFSDAFSQSMNLVGRLIKKNFGTRVFYVSLNGFDTHADQAPSQSKLLEQLAAGLAALFDELRPSGDDKRVLALTFSEFGRRLDENASRGTDHGAASCLFAVGPAVKGGPIGKYPSLKDLDAGDLKYGIDFRQVYATILDQWLHCDSRAVLNGSYKPIDLFKTKS